MADVPEGEGPPDTPDWIVTFTDLMSLLLTFFILLLTFSTPKVEKLFELRGSIQDSFGVFSGARDDRDSLIPASEIRQGREYKNPYAPRMPPRFQPLEDHEPNEEILALRDRSGEAIEWERINEGYRISIRDAITYDLGELDMSSTSFARLLKVVRAVRHMPYHLVVVGSTGARELPLLRRRGEDPMDLAIRRAVRVAQRLNDQHEVATGNMGVAGYGPQRHAGELGRVEFILVDRSGFSGR